MSSEERTSWRYTTLEIDLYPEAVKAKQLAHGIGFCIVVAMAGHFIADRYGGPVILLVLLLGMAFNALSQDRRYAPGIEFCAKHVLRAGVALLGARITLGHLQVVGFKPVILVIAAVPFTLLVSYMLGRLLRIPAAHSVLAGSAVAICGASAALAVAAVMPRDEHFSQRLMCVIIGVTGLSTIAMLIYPAVSSLLNMDPTSTALFLGGTIHDVAQVAGAGYLVSEQVGDLATFTKMLRVAALVPLVMILAFVFKPEDGSSTKFPGFLLIFIVLVLSSSTNVLPEALIDNLSNISGICLLLAIAALGVKTNLAGMAKLGWRPMAQMVGNTIALALFAMALLCIDTAG